jgi:isopentenyl diphosphate isomerase/L-lactate dehydrogenase-like FMN-dependent dehydrogenase
LLLTFLSYDEQDAEKAIEIGVEGIVVSNHGLSSSTSASLPPQLTLA